jgi:hypothetical protein
MDHGLRYLAPANDQRRVGHLRRSSWKFARCGIVIAASLGALGAAPSRDEGPLPLPPMPPAQIPAYETAPLPDQTLRPPSPPPRQGPALSPTLFGGPQQQFRGDGYVPNSGPQSVQERPWRPTPGVNLQVPLP